MPRRKPAGWPRYMRDKRLRSGVTGYFWAPPSWAREGGCTVKAEALGTDYGAAKRRCDEVLNPQLDAWRTKADAPTALARVTAGTFDWLVAAYKSSPRFTDRPEKTRKNYDAVLRLLSAHTLKDGRKFGSIGLASITPGAVDRLAAKLRITDDGRERARTVKLAMTVAKTAWATARRDHPKAIPAENPFAGVKVAHKPMKTRPVTHDELLAFVAAADAEGDASIGTAAMIAFYWLQRQVDILTRLSWSHYRPAGKEGVARIWHHKTGEEVDLPLFDHDGSSLWPELMARLDTMPRHGTLIVTRDKPDRRRKVHLPWAEDYFRHRVSALREAAGIDSEAKFMGLRHGGNTEGADAGLTDAQLRALSGHKTSAMVLVYARETMAQRQEGARKRRNARTKPGEMSE